MPLLSAAARVLEEPVRRVGAVLHRRLPASGLEGLDPDIARAFALIGPLDSSRLPVPLMRAGYRLQTMLWHRPRDGAVTVHEERVNDHVRVRVYTPHLDRGGGLVYFHGGGMVIGDLDTHDRWCRWIATRAGVVVHSVDYRRAPEHPFPAGCLDALAAWNHVVAGWQAQGRAHERLGVGGDSAGGYLAAVVTTQAIDPTLGLPVAGRPSYQWLLYPSVDAVRRHEEFDLYPSGVLLTGRAVRRFTREWIRPGDDPHDPAHSPGLVPDQVVADLPPTHLVTCEFDPLLPECRRLLARLESVGVVATHDHLPDMPHEFISMSGVSPAAARAGDRVIDSLARIAGTADEAAA